MEETPGVPRGSYAADPMERFAETLAGLIRAVDQLQRSAPIRDASIGGGAGLTIITEDGAPRVQLRPDGTVVAFDEEGEPKVRMGRMLETGDSGDPFGIEIEVAGNWIQLGTQSVAWNNVGGKPGNYDATTQTWKPSAHQHAGGDISGRVANASNADVAASANHATTAGQTDGVTAAAFARDLAGIPGSYKAMWMHSSGQIGTNTSTETGKVNIRAHQPEDPYAVLALQESVYDRRAAGGDPYTPVARTNEIGLIAQEVAEVIPELVVWDGEDIDGVRYDLLALHLLPAIRAVREEQTEQREEIGRLESAVAKQQQTIDQLKAAVKSLGGKI